MLGLGSILGTGVFVSIGIAAGVAGPAVILAIVLAAGVALCNALSSAQLAANHPVSGGAYEYGYRYLSPSLGFAAGWMFLSAKTASAATAALGFAGYLKIALGLSPSIEPRVIALVAVLGLTFVVLSGIRLANWTNTVIVSVTLTALTVYIATALPQALDIGGHSHLEPFFTHGSMGLLQATALMFVAYTGYGRIATLGEEVIAPRKTIPRAIIATLAISAIFYVAVASVSIAAVGADRLQRSTQQEAAPLAVVVEEFGLPAISALVAVGAMTAMLGVLLNLILGLSRILLPMGRRGDMPRVMARLNSSATTPFVAVATVGLIIAALTLVGNIKTTWSFSAFTVLVYYAITNLAALKLTNEERLYSPWFARLGLVACLFLAFWVDRQVWLTGLGLLAIGLVWHWIARMISGRRSH